MDWNAKQGSFHIFDAVSVNWNGFLCVLFFCRTPSDLAASRRTSTLWISEWNFADGFSGTWHYIPAQRIHVSTRSCLLLAQSESYDLHVSRSNQRKVMRVTSSLNSQSEWLPFLATAFILAEVVHGHFVFCNANNYLSFAYEMSWNWVWNVWSKCSISWDISEGILTYFTPIDSSLNDLHFIFWV